MASRLITCPETAHLELIDFDDSPLGMLISGCSRFQPACAAKCPRTCAARFDRRDRAVTDGTLDVGDETNLDVLGSQLFTSEPGC